MPQTFEFKPAPIARPVRVEVDDVGATVRYAQGRVRSRLGGGPWRSSATAYAVLMNHGDCKDGLITIDDLLTKKVPRTMSNLSLQVLSLLSAALCIPATGAQITATPIAGQAPAGARPMPGQVLVVDAAGQGDFTDLSAAVAAAPERALLLIKPGSY